MLLSALLLASLSTPGFAQDVVCLGAACIDAPVRDMLADSGVHEVDGLALEVATDGSTLLTISSTDSRGLERFAAQSRSTTRPIDGTSSVVATVPISLPADDTLMVDGGGPSPVIGLLLPAVQGPGGGGGSGSGGQSGGSQCYLVCQSTESGTDCWWHCQ